MFHIKQHPDFLAWINSVRDVKTRARLDARLRKVSFGLLGDVKPVGQGVFEMREHFGLGWRMYYIQRGQIIIVMLGGGDKSSQSADIARAIALAQTLED